MENYSLKVTDNSGNKKFGSVFDKPFTGDDVVDCITQVINKTCGEDYKNHDLNLCFKSSKNEVNLSWKQFINEGFELDGIRYTDDEDSRNEGNYWE